MSDLERFLALRRAVDYIEFAVAEISRNIGTPQWVREGDSGKFRYAVHAPQIVQLCKAVRAVSAFNGCLNMLPDGLYAEIMIVLRSAYDFIAEIFYLHEGFQSQAPMLDHQRFIDHFFEEHGNTIEEIMANPPRASVVERKKIHASQARILAPRNQYDMQKRVAAIDAIMSGYTHGAYPTAMELYEGGTERFRMRGMADTPRAREAEHQLVIAVHRAFNAVGVIAWSTNVQSVFDLGKVERKVFEQSAACEGMGLNTPDDDRPDGPF